MGKGFNDWVEIFKAGTFKDSKGVERTFSTGDLDVIIQKYDPKNIEAPAVVGHPVSNGPAWGWVEALKREGSVLFAKFKEVHPAFAKCVEQGFYKKRSISVDPKDGLLHVGFLGANPPAVPGLADIQFRQNPDNIVIEFQLQGNEVFFSMNEEELKKLNSDLEQAKKEIANFSKQIEEKDKKIEELEGKIKTQTEKAEFSAQQEKTELQKAQDRIAVLEKEQRKTHAQNFCSKLIEEGKMTNAELENTVNFMMSLSDDGSKDSQLANFQKGLESRPVVMQFGEHFASGQKSSSGMQVQNYSAPVDQDEMEIHTKALNYQKEHNVDYEIAVDRVMKG